MSEAITVDIASPPDREYLVAELFSENEQWAEVNQESGSLTVELYPRRDGQPWSLGFEETLMALRQAQQRLTGTNMDNPTCAG
jgi:hypothetical protein